MARIVTPSLSTIRVLLALTIAAAIAACIEWDRSTSTETTDIRLYISGVQSVDGRLQAEFREGNAPAGGSGPVLTANVPAIVLKGGAAQVTFRSTTAFSRLVVAVDGVSGYWDLALPAADTAATVLVVYAQQVGAPSFDMLYAGGSGATLGGQSRANTAFLGNGTGEVQVNISWDSKADVDLYVVDPFGEEIYYAHRGAGSGGQLDIDSNAACITDGPRAENIFWPFGVVPPKGDYTVRANYWSACNEDITHYTVTIRTKGGYRTSAGESHPRHAPAPSARDSTRCPRVRGP